MRYARLTLATWAIACAGWAGAQTTDSTNQTDNTATTGTAGTSAPAPGAMSEISCSVGLALTDVDNDGTISKSEFDTWRNNGFAALDKDGNGELSRQEYTDCMNEVPTDQASAAGSSGGDIAEADTNADGTVSADEYMNATNQAQQQAETGQPEGVVILRRLVMVPAGMPDEDLGAMPRAEVAQAAARRFRSLDANADGEISQSEMDAPAGRQGSDAWANADFDAMDANGDDVVDQTEFLDAAEDRWTAATEKAGGAGDQQASDTSGDTAATVAVPVVYYYYFGTGD